MTHPGLSARALTGTGLLTKLALRHERRWIPLTVVAFVLTLTSSARAISVSLGSLHERRELASTLGASPAFLILLGPFEHPDTIASSAAWRIGLFMMTTLSVLVAMTVVRHTRKQEEAGLHELVGAARTGRLAPLMAGLLAAFGLTFAVAVAVVAVAVAIGSPVTPALAYGAQYAALGAAAAGTTAVLVQIVTSTRTATGMSVGIVLAGYVARGLADAQPGWDWLRWLTPIGWAEQIDPYGERRWWPIVWSLLLAVAGVTAAALIRERRDLGSGLIQPRPGRARARWLTSQFALAWRLESRPAIGWLVGLGLFAWVIRSVRGDLGELDSTSPQFNNLLARLGGFDAAMAGFVGVFLAGWALTVTGLLRSEEQSGRAELLLATRASRPRLVLAIAAVVVPGSVVMALMVGWVAGSVRAELVQLPAVWVTAATAVALHGVGPRWEPLAWVLIGWSFLVGQIGVLLDIPEWLQRLSPFSSLPKVPFEPWSWPPVLTLTAVAIGLVAVALVLVRRRDLPAAR